jgi:hypothetical protein
MKAEQNMMGQDGSGRGGAERKHLLSDQDQEAGTFIFIIRFSSESCFLKGGCQNGESGTRSD